LSPTIPLLPNSNGILVIDHLLPQCSPTQAPRG
jgi:hypothetical protein